MSLEEKLVRFWKQMERARQLVKADNKDGASEILSDILAQHSADDWAVAEKHRFMINEFSRTYGLDFRYERQGKPARSNLDSYVKTVRPGISLVTCCKNRNENLVQALSSWLVCPEIAEVVIVDWTSADPVYEYIRDRGFSDPRIKVFRVEHEPRWILSYAFNVGFRASSCEKIIKVDADIVLDAGFFQNNELEKNTFITGNWRHADAGQEFINGFFYISRKDLLGVNGFSELITTYGWDDDDLYDRLQTNGLTRKSVDCTFLNHLPHDDSARLEDANTLPLNARDELVNSTKFKIIANKFMTGLMPLWNSDRTQQSFSIETVKPGFFSLERHIGAPHAVPSQIREDAEHYAAIHMISWQPGCYRALELDRLGAAVVLQKHAMDAILGADIEAALQKSDCNQLDAPSNIAARPKLFIDAQHGLGNRLRAIASAAAIAENDNRELVVVWQPDHHCECRMTDLFQYDGALIETGFLNGVLSDGLSVYNYMEAETGADKDAAIELKAGRDIYARSAYALNSPLTDWVTENDFLKKLKLSGEVLGLMNGVRRHNLLGVHVRMEGGKGLDSHSYERSENWTTASHAELHYWRNKSHFSHFMKRIDDLIKADAAETIFLATDRAETYAEFIARYGDRIAFLEREVFDRSKLQIQYALADVLLLSNCQKLLGSSWSSFSELALRLSDNFKKVEMSGKDF